MVVKIPAEHMGYSTEDRSNHAEASREKGLCPFKNSACHKRSGVCSVKYSGDIIAICPSRFREKEMVMKDIAMLYFQDTHDLLVFDEVYSGEPKLGSFDYVMVKHKQMSSEIEDLVIIEFQTVDTTNTGCLNQAIADFKSGLSIQGRSYNFGLNWSNVWKRCFIQILNKGRVLEKWGSKAFWVVQEQTYQYFIDAYGLKDGVKPGTDGSTIFMVYDLRLNRDRYELYHSRTESTNVTQLINAFANNPTMPDKSQFIARLESQARRSVSMNISFESE